MNEQKKVGTWKNFLHILIIIFILFFMFLLIYNGRLIHNARGLLIENLYGNTYSNSKATMEIKIVDEEKVLYKIQEKKEEISAYAYAVYDLQENFLIFTVSNVNEKKKENYKLFLISNNECYLMNKNTYLKLKK